MIARLVAIDPGYARAGRGCACAAYERGSLVRTWFARPEATLTYASRDVGATLIVWECPQIEARTRIALAQTLVTLAATGATLAGLYAGASGATVEAVTPRSWKGNTAKPVHHARLWSVLDDAERAHLGGDETWARIDEARRAGASCRWDPARAPYYGAWIGHNLLDAVALGAWRLGRLACTN